MKSFSTVLFVLLFYFTAKATIWPVSVSNFQFSPAIVNAIVGDTIQFNWVNGTHTTTCGSQLTGTSLPAGAAEWNNSINSTHQRFSYKLTVAGPYNYGCVLHYDRGMKGVINASGPLPLQLGYFNVADDKNIALLQWQTMTESNVAYFSVKKSVDGIHFSEIGRVNATGNSSKAIGYSFSDNDPGKVYKYLYYEIAIVDIDKKETLSPIKTLRNSGILKDNLIVALSPNPVIRPKEVQLKFNADQSGEMNISVYSSAGQLVLHTKMAAFYGLNNGHLHVCDLNKGIYNIKFTLAGKTEIRKIVVL